MEVSAGRASILLLLVATLAGLLATPVLADTHFKLVRITCVPEARYAAVETIGIYNVGPEERAALAAEGFQELSILAKAPAKCELPQGRLVIEVVDYHAPEAQGMCGAVEDGNLKILLAGREVVQAKSTHGGCSQFHRHDIRVSEYGIQHCILTFDDAEMLAESGNAKVEANCKNTRLF
jgi:hypothetical protein